MTTITCDRCGIGVKYAGLKRDPADLYRLEVVDNVAGDDEHMITIEADLCRACHEALVNWLKAAPLP
jgi:hypothetical protein